MLLDIVPTPVQLLREIYVAAPVNLNNFPFEHCLTAADIAIRMSAEDILKKSVDDDDVTVTSGSRTTANGPVEAEILVRFQLPSRSNVMSAKQLQTDVLLSILQAFPEEIIYIDNKNEEFAYSTRQPDEGLLQKLKHSSMTAHEVRTKKAQPPGNRWIVIMRFRTTIPFRDWKKHDVVINTLRTNRVYMTPHQFQQSEWDIISLGFLLGIHVVQFPAQAAKEYVQKLMQHDDPNPPTFSVNPSKVQLKGKPVYTRAYEVVCKRSDGQKLYQLLTHGKFRDPNHRIFVPYSLKRTSTSAFASLIKENNQMLADSYVMKFQGIPTSAIPFLETKLISQSGVRYVVPTSRTTTHGEWRILIKASKFSGVNGSVRSHWSDWCQLIPTEHFDNLPDSFPAPAITSRNVKSVNNDDEESAGSYGTLLSTASTLTVDIMDEDDKFDTCPLDMNIPSYAQVLTSNNYSSPASTITPSVQFPTAQGTANPPMEPHPSWEDENRQLQQRLREQEQRLQQLDLAKLTLNQRLEQILDEVQNKECRTKELENTIAQLLSVVADRDKQMAERDEQIDRRNRQFDEMMAKLKIQSSGNPATLDDQNATLQIPPATPARSNKRQNTLHTPDRRESMMECSSDDPMHEMTDDTGPIIQC